MKIAYICLDKGIPVFGNKGASIHIQEVLRSLKKRNASIKLFANRIDGIPPESLRNIKIFEIPLLVKPPISNSSLDDENQVIQNLLEKEGPFDLFYERYSLWSFGAMELAKSKNIPSVLEVNSPLIDEQKKYRELFNPEMAEWSAYRTFNAAKEIVAVSDGVSAYLSRFSCTKNKINVISNGVNPSIFDYNSKTSKLISNEIFTIGFVGTLKPWHGLSILVEAFEYVHKKNPKTRLQIVGDGPETKNLKQDLQNRNLLDSTQFTGLVSHSEIPSILNSMDVAVAPYPKMENFYFSPLKVFEYMAAGLPVVASNIGQLSDLITNEVNGFLYAPGNSRELSNILLKLSKKPNLCKKIGQEAKNQILQNHTWDNAVRKILSLVPITTGQMHYGGFSQ